MFLWGQDWIKEVFTALALTFYTQTSNLVLSIQEKPVQKQDHVYFCLLTDFLVVFRKFLCVFFKNRSSSLTLLITAVGLSCYYVALISLQKQKQFQINQIITWNKFAFPFLSFYYSQNKTIYLIQNQASCCCCCCCSPMHQ